MSEDTIWSPPPAPPPNPTSLWDKVKRPDVFFYFLLFVLIVISTTWALIGGVSGWMFFFGPEVP